MTVFQHNNLHALAKLAMAEGIELLSLSGRIQSSRHCILFKVQQQQWLVSGIGLAGSVWHFSQDAQTHFVVNYEQCLSESLHQIMSNMAFYWSKL